MSPVSVTARELICVAQHLGFSFDRQKGSHTVYVRGRDRVVIPVHAGRTIQPKTLAGILDDMGITVEELRRLL